jgi:hypothetical protein
MYRHLPRAERAVVRDQAVQAWPLVGRMPCAGWMVAVTTVTAVTAQAGTGLILSQYGGKYKKPQMVERTDSGQDVSSRVLGLTAGVSTEDKGRKNGYPYSKDDE